MAYLDIERTEHDSSRDTQGIREYGSMKHEEKASAEGEGQRRRNTVDQFGTRLTPSLFLSSISSRTNVSGWNTTSSSIESDPASFSPIIPILSAPTPTNRSPDSSPSPSARSPPLTSNIVDMSPFEVLDIDASGDVEALELDKIDPWRNRMILYDCRAV